MPNMNEILLKLESFKYATSLDLYMGYYHIQIIEKTQFITIIPPRENNYTIFYQWELVTH